MKVILRLTGGLGNQLFQYATGRALVDGIADARLFWHFEDNYPLAKRLYSLTFFNVQMNQASRADIERIGPERGVRRRVKQILGLETEASVWRERSDFRYDPSIFSLRNDCYIIGFWQSFRYFESIRGKLLSEIELLTTSAQFDSMRRALVEQSNTVAVHIRRSDYLSNKSGFHPLQTDYYDRAMKMSANTMSDPHYYFFTDDVRWLRDYYCPRIGNANWEIVSGSGLTDSEELVLMSDCKHAIIANSSFSWWGAWLNRNGSKKVWAPKNWNGIDERIFLDDLIPESWIKC